jgi:hypothetical protein
MQTTTQTAVEAGMTVTFRPDFSDALVGIVFEIVARSDGPLVSTEFGTDREFVMVRTRVGKSRRWGYRLAYLADLLPSV